MSIDRIGRPDPDNDADKPDSTRSPGADLSRSRKSVNEEFLDAMADGRIIRREDSRETVGDSAESETHSSSDTDRPESTRPPVTDLPRSRKSVNEEFLDAMDGGWIVGRDDSRETVSNRSRSEGRSDNNEQAGVEDDLLGEGRDWPAAEKDTRAGAVEHDENTQRDETTRDVALVEDASGPPPEGWQVGDGGTDHAGVGDSDVDDAPEKENVENDPDTDNTTETIDGSTATSEEHESVDPAMRNNVRRIDLAALERGEPVLLTDGSTRPALSAADKAAAAAKYEAYDSVPVKGSGAAKDYQVKVYGENERRIPLGVGENGRALRSEPDGFTAQYGAVGDSKYVGSPRSSFYIPDTLPEGHLRGEAIKDMDKVLSKLQKAADKVMGGDGVVELTTNNTKAADFIESRMTALGIRGYVRIVPE